MAQLQKFKTNALDKPESQTSESGLIFQLNYHPEHAKLAQTSRVTDLEQRIRKLETVLGANSDKLSRLSNATSKSKYSKYLICFNIIIIFSDTLMETAQHLSATVSLLDSNQLDHIEARLASLSQKMNTIAEKKKQFQADADKDQMVGYLLI